MASRLWVERKKRSDLDTPGLTTLIDLYYDRYQSILSEGSRRCILKYCIISGDVWLRILREKAV